MICRLVTTQSDVPSQPQSDVPTGLPYKPSQPQSDMPTGLPTQSDAPTGLPSQSDAPTGLPSQSQSDAPSKPQSDMPTGLPSQNVESQDIATKPQMPLQQGMGYDDELSEELQHSDLTRKMTVNPDIMFSENTSIKTLERHLLATARFPGESYPKQDTIQKEGRVVTVTPFVTVRGVQWYEEVVIKGIYDEDFSNSVDTLLEEEDIRLMNGDMKDKIDRQLQQLQENELFDRVFYGRCENVVASQEDTWITFKERAVG